MKKFLSLVLALVMTMSLVTISAGAKDFTDADKVNYDEAIAVLSAVKVIDGYTDGSFKPQTPLNRGQAAKIICNLVLGPTTAAELSATVAPFSDVPANNIFAGYITYCANEGIICGYGDGTFRPTGSLTGYAFLKMLLGALGYDADIEGYNNPGSFGIQVAKQAIGIGLNKGLKDTFNGNKTVTREEACLYALNTLKATMVEYDQKIVANVNGAQITVGTSLAKEVKWNIAEKKNDGNIKADEYVQFAEKYFPKLELTTDNGIYGRPTNVWKLKKSEIGAFASVEPTFVYTESTKAEDIYKDLGKVICDKDEYDWVAYINGKPVAANAVAVPTKDDDNEYAYSGDGAVTEIYVEDSLEKNVKGTVTVCEINYYLGQVSKVKTDDDGEYITVKELSKEPKLGDKTFHVEGYAEDDYVVFTVDYNDDDKYVIGEVCEPETVTGEVVRVEKNKDSDATYIKLDDGEKYPYSGVDHIVYDVDNSTIVKEHPALTEDYILYMDPNGFVLGFAKAEETVDQYLYVEDADEHLGTWEAKVVLADGTTAKVELKDELKGTIVEGQTNGKTADGFEIIKSGNKNVIGWVDKSIQHTDTEANIVDRIWKYSKSDKDVYTLTYVENIALNDAEIHNGKAYITEGVNEYIVDKKTVFVDVDGEAAYTGYKEVPNIENAEGALVVDKKVGVIVFVTDGDIYDENSTYFMLLKDSRESLKYDGNYYWEYSKAYVNGEKTSLTVAYDADKAETSGTVLKTNQLYKAVKSIEDGQYITEVEKVAFDYNDVTAVGDDAFWITDVRNKKVKYDTDEDTIFVLVEYKADGTVDAISEGDINDLFTGIDEDGFGTFVTIVKDANDHNTARLVYIQFMEAMDVPDAPVVKPGERTIAVDGNAGIVMIPDPLTLAKSTPTRDDVDVTLTVAAEKGYTITDIACDAASYINVATGKVTIPAGKDDVTITVETVGHEYTLTTASEYWDIEVKDAKGNVVNDKVTVGETYTVVATATEKDGKHNGARAFFLDGKKASDATLKTEGKASVKETIIINNATELKLCQKLAADGNVYKQDDGSVLNEKDIPATSPVMTNCWYYTDLGAAAVQTGSFTVAYDADGALKLTIDPVA